MTKIKFCGLSRVCDITAANEISPEYAGFVFAPKSIRRVTPEKAMLLKSLLSPHIQAVGVFADEKPEVIAALLGNGTIDIAQLHGKEEESYLALLRTMTRKPIIKAFRIRTADDIETAKKSTADHILLDSGSGTGTVFDWDLLKSMDRPYFLAGGLTPDNAAEALALLHPFAVDVSSGIETNRMKDKRKMAAFAAAVRK